MTSLVKQALQVFVVCFIGSAALANEGSVIFPDRPGAGVELHLQRPLVGREASDILKVFVGAAHACCDNKSPIAGSYSSDDKSLTFKPAFDFIEGQRYTVQLNDGDLREFTLYANVLSGTPDVVAIYPSGHTIPENSLRFYVHFSQPMAPHVADEFIKLIDSDGKEATAAFMSISQELWNEERTRLTLLMDPGRIKRGVAQNLALGPALLEGNRYSILVKDGWPSAVTGQETQRFEKSFQVSPALRSLPDADAWQFEQPKLMSEDPLVILFDRPFDHQLAQKTIIVRDENGQRVEGHVTLKIQERSWHFQPDAHWKTRKLQIEVDARLEDVAGNNFNDLLDHALGTEAPTTGNKTIYLDLMPSP